MKKYRTAVYIMGGVVAAIALLLILFTVMAMLGYIYPRPVKVIIRTSDSEQIYDGTPLTCENHTILQGDIADDHTLTMIYTSSQTLVGSTENTATPLVVDSSGYDVTDTYVFEMEYGELTVIPRPMTVASQTKHKVYDGTPLTGQAYTVLSGSLAPDQQLSLAFAGSQTLVGASTNAMVVRVLDANGVDVTEQYDLSVELGTLTVLPRPLEIRSDSESCIYDGLPLTNENYHVVTGDLAPEQQLEVIFTGTQTLVGESQNTMSIHIFAPDGTDVTEQYDLSVKPGTLTIRPRPLALRSDSEARIYDGLPLTNENYRILAGELAPDQRLEVIFTGTQTLVGESQNTMSIHIFAPDGTDVTEQYKLKTVPGKLQILPRPLTFSTASAERVYNGSPLQQDKYTIVDGTVADGETIDVSIIGSQTVAGQSLNNMSVRIRNRDGMDVTNQYDLHYNIGVLTVTPCRLAIRSGSATKVYDGSPLSSSDWEIIGGKLCTGQVIEVKLGGSQTEVGSSDNRIAQVVIYDTSSGGRVDVTESYQLEFDFGTLSVKPARP